MSKKHSKALLFAIISPIFSNLATIVASVGTKDLTPFLFLSVSVTIGSTILLLLFYASGNKINFKEAKKHTKDLTKVIALRGLLGNTLLMVGLSITSGIVAIFFTKMEPYFVLLWNWVLGKERIEPKYLVLLAVHIFGVLLLATGGALVFKGSEVGDLLIIAAMAMFALSYIPAKTLSEKLGAARSNILTLGTSTLIIVPISIILLIANPKPIQQIGWFYVVLYTIFFYVISLTLWFSSLKGVKGWIVSALRAVGPLVGAPLAYIFFGQTLTTTQILGAIIVLATSSLLVKIHTNSTKK
jgi:drug/metabolite transporter (DMT)-like permease